MRQDTPRLDFNQRTGQVQEVADRTQVELRHQFQIRQILLRDQSDGQFGDLHLVLPHQIEQQVERPAIGCQVDLKVHAVLPPATYAAETFAAETYAAETFAAETYATRSRRPACGSAGRQTGPATSGECPVYRTRPAQVVGCQGCNLQPRVFIGKFTQILQSELSVGKPRIVGCLARRVRESTPMAGGDQQPKRKEWDRQGQCDLRELGANPHWQPRGEDFAGNFDRYGIRSLVYSLCSCVTRERMRQSSLAEWRRVSDDISEECTHRPSGPRVPAQVPIPAGSRG